MLAFVGLGIDQSPTCSALEFLEKCDRIFYESYTSPSMKTCLKENLLTKLAGKEIEPVKREFVEDGRKILNLAKNQNVALLTSGDPLIATTHQELRIRAMQMGIETKVLHGSSIFGALAGETGLSMYSFGKTVTITRAPIQYTAYLTIYQNLLRGLHTMILLEWDESMNFFLSPKDAISTLLDAEKDLKYGILSSDTLLIGISQIGRGDSEPKITACSFTEAATRDFGDLPLSLVVPGKLHFTETEALEALTGKAHGSFRDNSQNIQKISKIMLDKYSKKTLAALERAREAVRRKLDGDLGKKYDPVFENVELYTDDALRFLNEGKEELAVLSIGYAEGLLDSLRFAGELEFEW